MKSNNNNKKLVLASLAILVIARLVITYNENKSAEVGSPHVKMLTAQQATQLSPDANLAKTPKEAVTAQNDTDKNNLCQSLRVHYQYLSDVKNSEKISLRFVNIHKKISNEIFRLRFFYKDSSESEIPSYLVYKEDAEGSDHLIETTLYKKGPLYLKTEKAEGSVIYTEEGVNIGVDQDLFLHYENKELKDLQGIYSRNGIPGKDFIECRF